MWSLFERKPRDKYKLHEMPSGFVRKVVESRYRSGWGGRCCHSPPQQYTLYTSEHWSDSCSRPPPPTTPILKLWWDGLVSENSRKSLTPQPTYRGSTKPLHSAFTFFCMLPLICLLIFQHDWYQIDFSPYFGFYWWPIEYSSITEPDEIISNLLKVLVCFI